MHSGHHFPPLLLARDSPEGLGRPRPRRVTLQEAPRVRGSGDNAAGTGLNCTFSTSVNKSFPFKVSGEARAKASSFSEERIWNPKDPQAVLPSKRLLIPLTLTKIHLMTEWLLTLRADAGTCQRG